MKILLILFGHNIKEKKPLRMLEAFLFDDKPIYFPKGERERGIKKPWLCLQTGQTKGASVPL